MVHIKELKAVKKFGPGYFIREQMELRDWIQEDLAEVLGITVKHLNKILQDKQPLTLDMARILGEAFDTSAEYWVNLDTNYRLWLDQGRSKKEKEADTKAKIYERMPIKDMEKKGWIKPYQSIEDLESQVKNFWGEEELTFHKLEKEVPLLMRKSEAFNQYNAAYQFTWYQMAQNVAAQKKIKPYNKSKLQKLYDEIHTYTTLDNGINQFIEALNKVGVAFFVLPHLQKTYLDGAAFLYKNNPVVVYTGRYKRIDNFWFTVAHEIAHVLKHLNSKKTYVLDNLKEKERDNMENEANKLAAEKLKHDEIVKYLDPYLNYLTVGKVEECAEEFDIHPAIIVGKLAYDKKISYSNQTLYNQNVLEIIDTKHQIIN